MALYNPSYDGLIGIANANSWGKRMTLQTPAEVATSARPQITAELMERTGLSDAVLTRLVHGFYDRVRPLSAEDRDQIAAVPFDEAKYKAKLGIE